MNRQASREIPVFHKFAAICPYQIVEDSIRKEEEPKPDISCKLRDGTSMAFELVECIDESFARLGSDTRELQRMLREWVEGLPINKREEINRKFRNAVINVLFYEEVSLIRKKRSIPEIYDYLLTLEDTSEGKYVLRDYKELENVVRLILINRGQYNRPQFILTPVTWVGEPAVKRIEDKFAIEYDTESTVELLAYYELQPEFPEDHWVEEVQDYLVRKIDNSPFERVWIYSMPRNHIIYVYPPI